MQNFEEKLEKIIKKDQRFVDQEGGLLKSEVIDKAYKIDKGLIEILLENTEVKKKFFIEIKKHWVFDINAFVSYIQDKNFLADSYTRFKNKIGLNIDGKFLNERKEVALVWPFKDCVLEGGMTKEDEKRKEIFFNEILAQDEIDQLFAPKVLTNWKRYTAKGEEEVKGLKRDEDGTIRENLLIKGNNLLALHSLKKQFQGKVKLIYIDPPYNTGNDSFGYNDNFNHSAWLTFMKNRLEIARVLLSENGSIWINIDDNESHYLKVLCDDIFGRENFVANIVWHKKNVVQNDAKYFNQNHDHILVFANNKENWRPNLLERTEEMNARYENPDNDPRGVWTSVALQAKSGSDNNLYEIVFLNGVRWKPVDGTYPRLRKDSLLLAYKEGRLWFGKNGKNVPRLKKYLSEVKQGLVPNTIFSNEASGSTQIAKEELKKLLGKNIFDTPKPEKLLQRVINIGSKNGDIILDFFAGSGTTIAVAHKVNRQYIGIEQMDYIHDLPESRLKKVIAGEGGGISKEANWKGGGSFVYCELAKYNEKFSDEIQKAKNTRKLLEIWKDMKEKSFLDYKVKPEEMDRNIAEFKKSSLAKQKETLMQMLNKNQMYVNLSEMKDKELAIRQKDKAINNKFYGKI